MKRQRHRQETSEERYAAQAQRAVRHELWAARRETGLSWFEVCTRLGWPLVKILKIEQGHWPVHSADRRQLLELYGQRKV